MQEGQKSAKTVLVIEDERMLLDAVQKKLSANGYNVEAHTNAMSALEYLKNSQTPPDAVWLDYYLEDMNGLEFMHKLAQNEAWKNIPVIVVSNSASTPKVNAMVALGVKKYFLKAENKLEDIVSELNSVLSGNMEGGQNGQQ